MGNQIHERASNLFGPYSIMFFLAKQILEILFLKQSGECQPSWPLFSHPRQAGYAVLSVFIHPYIFI